MKVYVDLTEDYIDIGEAARRLDMAQNGVHSLIRRERLGVARTPHGTFVCLTDVLRYRR